MSNFKKAFSVAVSTLTAVSTLGLGGLLASPVSAAAMAGDLIKLACPVGSGVNDPCRAVYYFDGAKRFVFPNQNTYMSWYADFSTVKTVPFSELSSYPIGGNVTMRPGTWLVKITTDPKVYAVEPGGKLRAIDSEARAMKLWGPMWNKHIVDVADAFFVNYSMGTAISSDMHPTGAVVNYASNPSQWYYISAGTRRPFASAAAATANWIRSSTFGVTTDIAYPDGASITGQESALVNVSGGASVITPGAGTGLSVALASDTPVSMTIATGSAYNAILKFNVTAGSDGAVNVKQLKLTKMGFLANSKVSGISVFANSRRYGNVVTTLGADGVAIMNLSSDPIMVSAGQTTAVWVKVNLASGSYTGTVSFAIASAADVMTNGATVSGTFPLTSNTMSVVDGSSSLAAVTVDEQPLNASGITLNVDAASEQEQAKFRLQETSSNEVVKLYGLRLYNNGTAADTDMKDMQLVQNGTVLATAQVMSKGVWFDLSANPFPIDKGQTKDFTVRGIIIDGANRTAQWTVYNDYDVDIRGVSTNSGILPTAGSNDTSFPIGDSTSTYNKVTIGSGTLTLSRSSDSPSQAVVPGANSVVLGKYDIQANGEDMEVRKVSFGLNQNTGSTNLTGTVYVKVDGSTVYSAAASTFAANGTVNSITLSSYPIIKSGVKSVVTIEVSVSSSATTSDAYFVNAFDVTQVKRIVTNDLVDPGVGTVSSLTRSVKTAAIKVSTLAQPVATSVVAGTNNVEFARLELNAQSSGENVRVSTIIVTDTLGSGSDYSGVNNLWMYNAADASKTPLQTSSSTATNANTVSFNFTNPIIVSTSSNVTLVLVGNVIASTGTSHTYKVASNTAHVTATGNDTGNSISTPTFGSGTGQTITVASGGTLTGSLVTGTGATPALAQVVNVSTSGGTYFAFQLAAQYESQKITSLTLRAAGTSLNQNDVLNLALYRQVGSAAVDANPFATASQFATCSSNACNNTWTATDNLLPAAIDPGTPVTIYAKADIGHEGVSKLGDDFYMKLDMTTGNDITAKGVQTATAPTYAGGNLNNTGPAHTNIVPFGVVVSAFAPTSSVTQTVTTNTYIGQFKIQNNGSKQVTLTDASFTDGGTHTGSAARYTVYASSENSSDYTANSLKVSSSDSVAFGTLTSSITINGGAYRYLTIGLSTATSVASGDSFALSVSTLGNLKYSVTEAALGYDANQDGDFLDTSTGLYVDGKPTLGTITKQ